MQTKIIIVRDRECGDIDTAKKLYRIERTFPENILKVHIGMGIAPECIVLIKEALIRYSQSQSILVYVELNINVDVAIKDTVEFNINVGC